MLIRLWVKCDLGAESSAKKKPSNEQQKQPRVKKGK